MTNRQKITAAILFIFSVVTVGAETLGAQEARADVLSFETPELAGWSGGPLETLSQDSSIVHQGRYAGRIDRGLGSPAEFSAFTFTLPIEFSGDTLELRGWLRTEDVSGYAGLWLREDGRSGPVQFDNMTGRQLRGTADWDEYRISLPLDDRAEAIFLGALLSGSGTIWVDDLRLFVDGAPLSDAPRLERVPSPVELDTEFDVGSGIETIAVTAQQVKDLAILGMVWGFAKYHHPSITGGEINWDYELFRILPSVLDAEDMAAADAAITEWLAGLGELPPCEPCAQVPVDAHLMPAVEWVHDRDLLSEGLRDRLEIIYDNRSTSAEQYYVSFAPQVGNPDFSNEAAYGDRPLPDAGFRLLSLYRFWNIIQYWFPYRDVIGEDWKNVLREFVPLVLGASSVDEYRVTLLELVARANDTHANLWRNLDVRPPRGTAEVPILARFVEGKAVVTGFSHSELGPATGLQVGDIIEAIDGQSIESLVDEWRPYYAASNEAKRLLDIARTLTRGTNETVSLEVNRGGAVTTLDAFRVPIEDLDRQAGWTHDLAGETFQLLSDEVAYLKLSAVVSADMNEYLAKAADARVLVVDIRNYPSEFVVFSLGGRLVSEPTEFARFTHGDATNPGAFLWTEPISLEPAEPHFSGAVVILVDETSLSQAEYTAMALRAVPGAIVVGSTTAGADGNVSSIPLPGGVAAMISGIGVFYPDKTPTQRVGIVPDLVVEPTIQGIMAGRDEVLEAGVSHVLGREFRLPK